MKSLDPPRYIDFGPKHRLRRRGAAGKRAGGRGVPRGARGVDPGAPPARPAEEPRPLRADPGGKP